MKKSTYYKIKSAKNILKIILIVLAILAIVGQSDLYKDFKNKLSDKTEKIIAKKENAQSIDVKNNSTNKTISKNNFSEKEKHSIVRVSDGDTIVVRIKNFNQKIRIIGLNTPEVYEQNGRVRECFGKEASAYAKKILKGKNGKYKKVFVETDSTQSKYDKHGRLLAHIFYEVKNADGRVEKVNFAQKMINDGYAYEYTYKGRKYKYQRAYKNAQKNAKGSKLGLWSKGTCGGRK